MEDNKFEQIYSEKKIKKAIRFGKLRSILMTIAISLVIAVSVFVAINSLNIRVTRKLSDDSYDHWESYTKLTVPNGYISNTFDTLGFFQGVSKFTISKQVGSRTVKLEDKNVSFGYYYPHLFFSSNLSRGIGKPAYAGEWNISQWENGYTKMLFFHPEISYKEYKNDLNELDNIPSDKIIEMGISFDRQYKISEIPAVLPDANVSWIWLGINKSKSIDTLKEEAKKYDAKSQYITEFDALGFSVDPRVKLIDVTHRYNELLELLNNSKDKKYQEMYSELESKDYKNVSDIPVLGAVVYGSSSELKALIGNPHIKASSFGVITSRY